MMIVGKDAPLEQSIATMTRLLSELDFDLDQSQWLNPVSNVWSVHLRDRNCSTLFSNGKGASKQAALASALGEFVERLSTNYFFADYYFGKSISNAEFVHFPHERWFAIENEALPEQLLDAPSLLQYSINDDLKSRQLIDTNSGNQKRGICALPFTRQRTKEEVWFPVNILDNLYVSNGMAAGNTRWEARVQALSEIFERHIKNTILSSGITLPRIPDEIIARYPTTSKALDELRDKGFHLVVNDASLGGKFPLVNVTLINLKDGGCCAAFGAHPKFEVALQRTVTELLQGRDIDQLNGFPSATFDIGEVADPHNIETHFIDSSGVIAWDLLGNDPDYPFTEWNIEGSSEDEFNHLCYLIHKVDMDIYISDYQHLGMDCCRIVVPGMSEIYPVDDLVWHNNNQGISMREPGIRLGELKRKECRALLELLEDTQLNDSQLFAPAIGILADKGSAFEQLRVGELKGLLYLALSEHDSALECLDWTLKFDHITTERAQLLRCLTQHLHFSMDPARPLEQYQQLLIELYGEDLTSRCQAMMKGEQIFNEYPVDDGSLKQFGSHSALLKVYKRLQTAKKHHLA